VAAGAASFFPLPALSDAVSLGILSTVYLERLLSTSIGTLGLGLYAGFTTFMPAGAGLAAYFQSLIPVGLDLRWTAFERSRLGLFVRLLGGAAVNVSDQSKVAGRLTRVLPQLKAGAGLTLALSRRVGISVEFLYEMLFYLYTVDGGVANDLIMGFNAPAICVYTKW
jgi:xanthine/uracil/vitamin C permease (AzgA family)